ncbi:MAG: NAD(P)-dependent oxidoreductase [Opitutae bacterium]|nr:NAD(P)-dependent oxidoreductase [Opitutae bacterium]
MTAPLPPLPDEDLEHVLAHTRELWRGAAGARFFITGGTGFFGMWLLESFARANDTWRLGMRATVLSRSPEAFARKAPHLATRGDLEFVAGDVKSFPFPIGRFPYVVHAAGDTVVAPAGADPEPVRSAIVDGTRRVLDFAAQTGARKFLLTSSGAVYGVQPVEVTHIPEEMPACPVTGYGQGKLAGEELCRERASAGGFEVKIARCFAFVGPHLPLDAHFAVGNFIGDALCGGPIQVAGDGTPQRSYLYAADLAVWLWTLLFRAENGRAYNVGSGDALTIAETADRVRATIAPGATIRIARHAVPGAVPMRYVPSVRRAGQELGLQARIPLDDALRRTAAWHR